VEDASGSRTEARLTVVRVEDLSDQQQEPLLRQAAHVQPRLPDKRHPQLLLQVTPLPRQLEETKEETQHEEKKREQKDVLNGCFLREIIFSKL